MPSIRTSVKRSGGRKLDRFLRDAGKGGVSNVRVGFFSDAKYQDGTSVAAVAAWNEFGTKNIPERPFFRRAISGMGDGVANILRAGIDPKKGVVDRHLADTVGAYAAGRVMESIRSMDSPKNAPGTVRAKGSSNPLMDTGMMRASVGWRVEDDSTDYPKSRSRVEPPEVAPT